MAMNMTPHVLIVAGSDSSGGAGIARDIETVASFDVRTAIAVTAITAQTHSEVLAMEPVDASLVESQMRAALSANSIVAIKIGMMATEDTVLAIIDVLSDHPSIPVVLDPVISSTSGARLLSLAGVELLRSQLLSLCLLATPNLPELGILAGSNATVQTEEAASLQARILLGMGCRSVLVKGGHAVGPESIDILHSAGQQPRLFTSPRYKATLRGTGCMLSSAIAANLALGRDMDAAIRAAQALVDGRFKSAAEPQPHQPSVAGNAWTVSARC